MIDILNFIAEAGILKRVKRTGWWMLGIANEESVADHSFRCAVIGYFLAKKEKAKVEKVLLMTLFNDIHESRITDLHKVAHTYIDVRKAEKDVFKDQVKSLDEPIKNEMISFRDEYDQQETLESIVARDADILECLVQAKEYEEAGYKKAKKFFVKAPEHLKTVSAKKMWECLQSWDSSLWWEKIGKFER
ncbi:MAG: HD domain-containing protein [Candidatus Omnitrophica bacterium]|nr:HD domain-containing protein [Candidatus Omnitrophota bacterium]